MHEHWDEFTLINMNGRVYDPVIGRFLSADPFIQSPDNSQGLNRYSYAWNNPLVVIDPSGYNNQWLIIGAAVVAIAVSIASYGLLTAPAVGMYAGWAALIAGAAGGFVGGVISTLAMGGNIGDALVNGLKGAAIGAYTAGLTFGIGSAVGTIGNAYVQGVAKIAAHGTFNGMRSLSQGGKFIHGFVAGAVGAASGLATMPLIEAGNGAWVGADMISAALGGTASMLTGGNFANGAVTAAFVTLFNTVAHQKTNSPKYDGWTEEDYYNAIEGMKLPDGTILTRKNLKLTFSRLDKFCERWKCTLFG